MPLDTPLPPHSTPRLADFIVRWRWLILIVTALTVGLAGWRVTKLKLKTDLAELLPEKDPAVVVMREMSARLVAVTNIVIAVESPSPAANRKLVDDLVVRLKALKSPEIGDVEPGVHAERDFLQRNKFLYPKLEQLEDAHDRVRKEILKRKNPAYVDLSGGDDEPLSAKRSELDKREQELLDKFPDGYYATPDRTLYAVVVRVQGSIFSERHGEKLAVLVQKTVDDLAPTRYHPEMKTGLTGNVMNAIAERKALEDDLIWATTVCILLISLVIFLFFGRLSALPYATVPALCGVTLALGFAQLAFGYLNASTAFMGSIIVGNGINYAIIQMSRYEEERRLGRPVRDAIAAAIGGTWRATAIASLGAAIAYGSLAITAFRGFNQFGYIGGFGMILSWLVTVLALPALWAVFDHRQAADAMGRLRGITAAAPIARFTVKHPKALLVAGAVLTVAAVIPVYHYLKDPFEYDFRKLGNRDSRRGRGVEVLSNRVGKIFGRALQPSFVLADDPSQVEDIRRQLREKDKQYQILGDVKTINDFLPGTPAQQREKLEILGRIRTLVDQNDKLLDDKEKEDVRRLRPPDELKVLTPRDLPMGIRRYFTEIDGTIGRAVVYFPKEKGVSVWDGRTQLKLAAVTAELKLPDGRTVRSSGQPAVFSGMIKSITHDGPIATLAALLGVALLVLTLTWRRGGSGLTLGVLCLGVVWMVGAAAWSGQRVNFLNFIALPITFGINVDYAINLLLRYQQEGRGRVRESVEATGAAVALCSLTTIIGYGALLVAQNQALRSFGALAIVGEFACLAAALFIMPAALVLIERRHAARIVPAPVAAGATRGDAHGDGDGRGDGDGDGSGDDHGDGAGDGAGAGDGRGDGSHRPTLAAPSEPPARDAAPPAAPPTAPATAPPAVPPTA